MSRLIPLLFSLIIIATFLQMCGTPQPSAYTWRLPPGVPPPPGASDQPARIELGRQLFYDQRLSGNERLACATCHRPELAFSDGRVTPTGATGETLLRNAPSLLNVGYLPRLTRANPAITSLEQQMQIPLFTTHPVEMGADPVVVLARLRADPALVERFAAAFPTDPDPLGWGQISTAIAAFLRTLVAFDTPYDRFVYQGDNTALTPAAQRGMQLFFSPGLACGHCHVDLAPPDRAHPPRWADLEYLATGAGRSADRGLATHTGRPEDAYRFRVPPLRNVAMTAPYMHDGSLPTLEAVLRFYESGGHEGAGAEPERAAARHDLIAGFVLSDRDRNDLLAFLIALTDKEALTNERYGDPFAAQH